MLWDFAINGISSQTVNQHPNVATQVGKGVIKRTSGSNVNQRNFLFEIGKLKYFSMLCTDSKLFCFSGVLDFILS